LTRATQHTDIDTKTSRVSPDIHNKPRAGRILRSSKIVPATGHSSEDSDDVLPTPRKARQRPARQSETTNADSEEESDIMLVSAKRTRLVTRARSLSSTSQNPSKMQAQNDIEEDLDDLQDTGKVPMVINCNPRM
jgi:hypothetical protein